MEMHKYRIVCMYKELACSLCFRFQLISPIGEHDAHPVETYAFFARSPNLVIPCRTAKEY